MSGKFVVALTTTPTTEKAKEIARTLVEEGLCACVNIVPGVTSVYRWEGKLCDETEAMCVIKTRGDKVAALRDRLIALHPYRVPELVVLEVTAGNEEYLAWVDASCS